MPLHPDFVKMLAAADRHKEEGYQELSKYMNSKMHIKFSPEIKKIIGFAAHMAEEDNPVVSAVGNLAMVAMNEYMERYESEILEKE